MVTEPSAVTVAAISSSEEAPAYSEASERLDRRSLIGLLIFCSLAVAGAVSLVVTSLITIHCSRPRVHRGEDLSAQRSASAHHPEATLPESFHFQADK